jgi:hypothetical protein
MHEQKAHSRDGKIQKKQALQKGRKIRSNHNILKLKVIYTIVFSFRPFTIR